MKFLRPIFAASCFALLLLAIAILGVAPASSQGMEIAPDVSQYADVFQVTVTPTVSIESPSPTFQITLADLGYGERILNSPYGTTEYTLRLPEGWELREGSFFELDLSYSYNGAGGPEAQTYPSLLGDIIISVDEETQLVFQIKEPALEHSRLRVALPPSLLNSPARNVHSIQVTLDASLVCDIPHEAGLIIHPTSFFSLTYNQLPVAADLALYPRPFYQRAFEPDQVRFVLPARPTEGELTGAVAIASKLGDLTYRMIISGSTDLELMDRLEGGEILHEHLIVIGRPQRNEVILKLNQLAALPVSLQERQLSLASEGPATAVPGGVLTYTLTLTNTGQDNLSSLSLIDTLPAYAQVVTCSPSCSGVVEGEVSWSIASLGGGETFSSTVELHLSEAITDLVIENTVTLFDAASNPINVNTLTTTVSSIPLAESSPLSSVSEDGYFFLQGGRAVPEGDGVVQEIVSPWDQTRAILIITGLNDEAVYKASHAMSFESHFPGMRGPFALVQEVHPLPELPPKPPAADLTFADLGYSDKVLSGWSQEADYYFDIPLGWRLNKAAYLELHFRHSQLLDYKSSFLNISFNNKPIATVTLSDETALNGELKVELSPSQARPGRRNRISIQAEMRPLDRCATVDMWLLLSSESMLHLDHEEQDSRSWDLDLYPHPFDQRSDLADVLFVLPPEPRFEEWEEILQLAAVLGDAAGGPNLAPAVVLGDTRSEEELSDCHFIVIGRPSRNPVLRLVNAQLPQPFLPDSDLIEQKLNEVVLRLPPDASLGYVQLITSPWNEARAFMAVTGTTDEGVKWAVDTLNDRPGVLKGNLTLIRDDEVNTLDTRRLTRGGVAMAVATAVAEMTPVATITVIPTPLPPGPTEIDRPGWLIPLVGIVGLVVVAIFTLAFWRARRRASMRM